MEQFPGAVLTFLHVKTGISGNLFPRVVIALHRISRPMILNYVHDPMCSWCWAYRPVLRKVRDQLPAQIEWRNIPGGLAPDSELPMPAHTREMVQGHWRRIQRELGTEFNFGFWTDCQPRRSTYIACRATLAASRQGFEERMITSIQEAYYLRAMNPSDEEVLVMLSEELGMDRQQFRQDLNDEAIDRQLRSSIARVRSWPVSGFPAYIFETGKDIHPVPLDYTDAGVTLSALNRLLNRFTGS